MCSCLDYIELFPYLREPVIENTTSADFVICNRTTNTVSELANDISNIPTATNRANNIAAANALHVANLRKDEFIYSAGKTFGIRIRFIKSKERVNNTSNMTVNGTQWLLNITGEYRFLKKENFKNDGRLIPGSYCDYYFFANTDAVIYQNIWKYFHSPRFPANYPGHIKCAYKFIGRPESRVEVMFEELQIPKQDESCSVDKLSIFDSESANTHKIDVICDSLPTRRIISSGPDLLIEFNVSSNLTAKGFRGKFKFLQNEIVEPAPRVVVNTTDTAAVVEKLAAPKQTLAFHIEDWTKFMKSNGE